VASAGTQVQDAASLLARAAGQLQGMATRERLSRAGIAEALAWTERAVTTLRQVLDINHKNRS
jgi:hypothetical protein